MPEHPDSENSTDLQVPAWVMHIITGLLILGMAGMAKLQWEQSRDVLTVQLAIAQNTSDITQLKADHNAVIQMSSDISYIKDKLSDIEARLQQR